MGNNCIGKSIEKEETITEHVQFFNQISLSEVRYAHLNHKGKIIYYRCRGHGALALNIKFEGLHHNMYVFGRLKRINSILRERKNGIRFADRF